QKTRITIRSVDTRHAVPTRSPAKYRLQDFFQNPENKPSGLARILVFMQQPNHQRMSLKGTELKFTGRLFGGIIDDIKRKAPFYKSDFTDGLHSNVAGTTLFLYFATLANAIAFG